MNIVRTLKYDIMVVLFEQPQGIIIILFIYLS